MKSMILVKSSNENFERKPISDNKLTINKTKQAPVITGNLERMRDVSEAIAGVRDKEGLNKMVAHQLKTAVGFDDMVMLMHDKDADAQRLFLKHFDKDRKGVAEFSKKINANRCTVDEEMLRSVLQSDVPLVWNVAAMATWEEGPSTAGFLKENRIKKIVALPLLNGSKNIGAAYFYSQCENAFAAGDLAQLIPVGRQLATAALNVHNHQQLIKKSSSQEFLLTLSNRLAGIRDHQELLAATYDTVEAFLPIRGGMSVLIQEEFAAHQVYSFPKSAVENITIKRHSAVNGRQLADRMRVSDGPVRLKVEDLAAGFPELADDLLLKTKSTSEVAGMVITTTDKILGYLFLFPEKDSAFKIDDLQLLDGIGRQFSLATANVIAYQALLEHNIAPIRCIDELQSKVDERLHHILDFSHSVTVTTDKENGNYARFLIDRSAAVRNQIGGTLFGESYPLDDVVLSRTRESNEPLVLSMDHANKASNAPAWVHINYEAGMQQVILAPMHTGGNHIGTLMVFSTSTSVLAPGQVKHIKDLAEQLSFASYNILANEAMLDQEKAVLLAISNDVAAIRSKHELLSVVSERLKKILDFDHTITMVTNREQNTYTGFLCDPNSRSKDYPGVKRIFHANYPLEPFLMQQVISANEPLLFDMGELVKRKDAPEWIKINYEAGLQVAIIAPLRIGLTNIGFFVILREQPADAQSKQFKLIRGISSQVSVAVANILAHEDLLEREQEKSTLLELSNHMAFIRNKADLHAVINEKLKKLLPISHIVTLKINDDGDTYSAYTLDPSSKNENHPDYQKITTGKCPINDGIIDQVLLADRPLTFELAEIIERPNAPKYLRMNHDGGMKEVILSALTDGERKTGILAIYRTSTERLSSNSLNIIKGISSQLSTAIANITANERIERQLEEINNYKQQLEIENLYLQEEIQTTHNYSELIGTSSNMQKIFHLVSQVAESPSSVLILGETGTGKELIARALHNASPRKDKVMIKVNCATLPANLIESELFGHERGSFTGATEKRIGKFELANNSTLFLDEVGELPLELQVKLLRALQEKEIERVGGRTIIKTNVRIIAATNRDLQKEVLAGNFRSDLYFRLNVFPITIPALRERKDDIPILATHFLQKHGKKGFQGGMNFSSRAIKQLTAYDWPGNVRELEHLIERSALLANGATITQVHLPNAENEDEDILNSGIIPNLRIKTIDEMEREHIISVLKKCNGKVSGIGGAAEILRIPSTTLNSKMIRLKITKGFGDELVEGRPEEYKPTQQTK